MKNIIIYPTDFSPCAENALNYAMALAKVMNSKLKVVHTIDLSSVSIFDENPRRIIDEVKLIEKETTLKFKKLNQLIKDNNIVCDFEIIKGSTTTVFPDYVEKYSPRLVVMGTTGSSNLENKIMGSFTHKVLKSTDAPILAIPVNATHKHFKEFIFASDLEVKDIKYLKVLVDIAAFFEAHVQVVHVTKNHTSNESDVKNISNFISKTTKSIDYDNLGFKLLNGANVKERLSILLNESEIDILSLVTQKRNFIESIFQNSLAKDMVHLSKTPLLIFSNLK